MSINVEELIERKTGASYPALRIVVPNDTVPLVVSSLKEGDMQLIIEFNGKKKCVARISESAINIQWLLRTVGVVEYIKSENEVIPIHNIEEYLVACV